MPRCCGRFWYPRPHDPTSRRCPECGSIPDASAGRRVITLDESVYEELASRKGDASWEDFLIRELETTVSPAVGD